MILVPLLLFVLIPTLLASICILSLLLYIALYRASTTTSRTSLGRSAAVVVLGDVGRSPRMCYHVESLADEGWRVAVVGYGGSSLPTSIQRSSVRFHKLKEVPSWIAKLPRAAFVAVAPLKLLWQSVGLFWKITMTIQPPPEVIFVQTPPALPTLLIIRICSLLLSSRVVIDWHNLGYTILGLRLGQDSPLVSFARTLERLSGRTAFAHLFVTHAMKRHLEVEWQLKGHKAVLHDRPPKHFRKAHVSETHTLWKGLAPRLTPDLGDFWPKESQAAETSTPFTTQDATAQASLRADRPALVVSSTSWTADEDFGLLLRAAQLYEKRAKEINGRTQSASSTTFSDSPRTSVDLQQHSSSGSSSGATLEVRLPASASSDSLEMDWPGTPSGSRTSHRSRRPSGQLRRSSTLPNTPAERLPKLLIVVTGKGELRSYYEKEVARLEKTEAWEFVRIRTAWLENWEYPLLLGSADLGVSLHTSSSGLDLPMKVVDMLGCHLPVLALDFSCLDELIQHGYNGLKFSNEEQLVEGLESLLADFPHSTSSEVSSSEQGNWLVRGGGLKEPFSLAGRETEMDREATPRSSGETSALLGGGDGQADPKRLTLDFSKGGLPTSSTFASQALPSPTGWDAYDVGGSRLISQPMTPTPSFTMVPSPILGPTHLDALPSGFPLLNGNGNDDRTSRGDGNNTWSRNWKATVRPLLRLADEEDARAEGGSLSDEEAEEADELLLASDHISGASPASGAHASGSSAPTTFPASTSTPNLYCASTSTASPTPQKFRRRLGSDGRPLRVRGGSVHGLLWGAADCPGSPPMGSGAITGTEARGKRLGGDGANEDDDEDDDDGSEGQILVGLLGTITPRSSNSPIKTRGTGTGTGGGKAGKTGPFGLGFTPLSPSSGSSSRRNGKHKKEDSPEGDAAAGAGAGAGGPSSVIVTSHDETRGLGRGLGFGLGLGSTVGVGVGVDGVEAERSGRTGSGARHLRQRTGVGIREAGIPDIRVSEVGGAGAGGG